MNKSGQQKNLLNKILKKIKTKKQLHKSKLNRENLINLEISKDFIKTNTKPCIYALTI